MSDPYELTETALSGLGLPYAADANRSALGTPLPDLFVVYKQVSGLAAQFADDLDTERFFRMQLSVFSRDGLVGLPDTDNAMESVGFVFSRATEIPFTRETGHYGQAREYTILLTIERGD